MKILQIGKYYYPHMGGIETHLNLLSSELARLGNSVTAVVSSDNSKFSVENLSGVKVFRYTLFSKFLNAPIYSFEKFDESRFDIIHLHLPNPFASIQTLLNYRKNIVVTYHSDIIKGGLFSKILNFFYTQLVLRPLLARAKAIIVTSPNYLSGSKILQKYAEKVKIISYSIDTKLFTYDESIESKISELKNNYKNKRVILFVGRLVPYKGLEYLIRAMSDVVQEFTNVKLLIIGDGILEGKLKNLTKTLNLDSYVEFISGMHNKNLVPYYHSADIFVLPSIYKSEAFGIVQLEAMACGKPVVSTNVFGSGISYVNKNNETGLVVEPKNPRQLSKSIISLLKNSALRRKFGNAGKLRVEKFFSKDIMIRNILDTYSSILEPQKES